MEIKKTEKASLENKRLIFAEVGLITALLVVLAGFESSTRTKEVALLQDNTMIDDEGDILAIPLDTPPARTPGAGPADAVGRVGDCRR